MKTYAIWKDRKVIGYIQLTKEQKNTLNNIDNIGVRFDFDDVTSPERCVADFESIVARLKGGETFEDISEDILKKAGEDVDDWPFECYGNDVYEDGDLYDFLEYVGAEICNKTDEYVIVKTNINNYYLFPYKNIPHRYEINDEETIISFDKDKMLSRIFLRALTEGQPHQVVEINGELRVLFDCDSQGGYTKMCACYRTCNGFVAGEQISDKLELFYEGRRMRYEYEEIDEGVYGLAIGKGQLLDEDGTPYFIDLAYCKDSEEFFFKFCYGKQGYINPPYNQLGEEARNQMQEFLLQLIRDKEEMANE